MPPNILDPNNAGSTQKDKDKTKSLTHIDYPYDYPRGLNLKPGSEFHDELLREVMARANDSHRVMARRYTEWREVDKVLRTYVPPEQADESSEGKRKTKSAPEIIIPHSHAVLETLLTYMTAAFLQNPIWNYEGVGPEDVLGSDLMTHLIHQQCVRNQVGLALHTQWRDAFAYGIGVVSPVWDRQFGKQTVVRRRGFMDMMRNIFTVSERERDIEEDVLLFEGNKLINIDPYAYLPDPNQSAHEVQEGEFGAWIQKTNLMDILRRDNDSSDYVFNARYLKHIDGRSTLIEHGVNRRRNRDRDELITTNNPIHALWMYVDIIPSDWGLGRSQYPETWLFGVGGDQVIIAAQPLGLNHGMKLLSACAPDYDGYTANPISRLGLINDIQNLIDFLYSSHIQNVRKAINDMFVIDPSIINYYDAANPEPGKLMRMRRSAWGKGVLDQAIKQFDVKDVTQGHVADSSFLNDVMQQVSSANDFLQGRMPHRTSRVSAAEVNRVSGSGLSRLEKTARIISMQSMVPVGYMFASHAQQLMERETYIKATGEFEQKLRETYDIPVDSNRVPVDPLDIVVNYDVIPHDGTIPGAESADTWIQLFQVAMSNPLVGQQLDIQRIFKHIARQMGAKNVEDFVKKAENVRPQVRPDEEVDREVQRGNLTPLGGNGSI